MFEKKNFKSCDLVEILKNVNYLKNVAYSFSLKIFYRDLDSNFIKYFLFQLFILVFKLNITSLFYLSLIRP